jgi:hypothetical protein
LEYIGTLYPPFKEGVLAQVENGDKQTILEINKNFMQPMKSLNMYSRGPNCFFLGGGGDGWINCF